MDIGAEHLSDQLRAQANTHHGLARRNGLLDAGLLVAEPAVLRLVADAHWPAHDDQPIEAVEIRQRITGIEMTDRERMTTPSGPVTNTRGAFEGDML